MNRGINVEQQNRIEDAEIDIYKYVQLIIEKSAKAIKQVKYSFSTNVAGSNWKSIGK